MVAETKAEESQLLTPVEIARKWGFINEKGQIVIQPQFDAVGTFSEGLAAVAFKVAAPKSQKK